MNSQNVPVISIDQLHRPQTLRKLDRACRDWGFFQVVDHGIDPELITRLQLEMNRFFRQPVAVKRAISRTEDNPWGFFDRELTKNTRDWKQVFDYGPENSGSIRPQWPVAQPALQAVMQTYYSACEALALRLLSAISVNLGMPAYCLGANFQSEHSSFVRLNYYPPCLTPARPEGLQTPAAGHLGVNYHTDSGALTLLLQDRQPGLEVFRKGQWHGVEPRDDALVINIGDIVQVWSNDHYRAALHRVTTHTSASRYSVPFFLNPAYSTDYAPLPSMTSSADPARYRPINWGEFRSARVSDDYADQGEEIQINRYRVATTTGLIPNNAVTAV
ncbi:MAG: 2OG-Fe(II) oxygenase family protein [Motiliproteus sp.]